MIANKIIFLHYLCFFMLNRTFVGKQEIMDRVLDFYNKSSTLNAYPTYDSSQSEQRGAWSYGRNYIVTDRKRTESLATIFAALTGSVKKK